MKLFIHSIRPAQKCTTRLAQCKLDFRPARRLLFWSHPSVGDFIISSLLSSVCTKRVVFPVGPRLSCGSGLALQCLHPPPLQFRVTQHLSPAAFPPASTLRLQETIRHHVRPRSHRHQRGHRDPIRYGGGQEGERHRGADEAAELSVHGGEGHLQRCA